MTDVKHLKALGEGKTDYGIQISTTPPDPKVLEKFENPSYTRQREAVGGITISISAPEFTSLCPKTSQPDYATIQIQYSPERWCVESKSLKLYLNLFRNFGEFHEACVDRIGHDLVQLLDPLVLQVQGQFTPRGGIKFWPTYVYQRPARGSGLVVPGPQVMS